MVEALIALAAIGAEPASTVPVQEEPLHRVVFVSKELRVFDVVLPPHVTTRYHLHSNDMVGVTLVPGPARDEELGKTPRDDPPGALNDVWFEAHKHDVHRVTNLGDSAIRVIGIELLKPTTLRNVGANKDKYSVVVLENERVRVTRFTLAPGQRSEMHSQGSYVIVSLGRGRLANVCGRTEQDQVETAGFLCVGVDRHHETTNLGNESIQFLEFELGG